LHWEKNARQKRLKKYGTGHATNKAFDRYFQVSADKKRELSAMARCITGAQRKRANGRT